MRLVRYSPKEYPFLLNLGNIPADVMASHLRLYHGYVKRFNQIMESMRKAIPGSMTHRALRKRISFEFDGMRLHELFFEQLRPTSSFDNAPNSTHPFLGVAQDQFGSIDAWAKDVTDAAMIPGSGWAIAFVDSYEESDTILNIKVQSHEIGLLAGCTPAFLIDVWEHAYEAYTTRSQFIVDVMKDTNWSIVGKRVVEGYAN